MRACASGRFVFLGAERDDAPSRSTRVATRDLSSAGFSIVIGAQLLLAGRSLTRLQPPASRITGNPKSLEVSVSMHPAGRIGRPEDLVPAARWLLDPASDWITG